MCSRQGAVQIHVYLYFTFTYIVDPRILPKHTTFKVPNLSLYSTKKTIANAVTRVPYNIYICKYVRSKSCKCTFISNYYALIILTALSLRLRQSEGVSDRKCEENLAKLPTYLSRKLAVWSSKTTRESRTLTAFDIDE